jgi:hypothetical protein
MFTIDKWPNERDDLSIPNHHLIWSFRRHGDNDPTVTFRVEEDRTARQVGLHSKYCLVLACFDLEYWIEIGNGAPTETKKRQLRKYFYQLRSDAVEEILAAQGNELRLGTKNLTALRDWSIRTWHNYRHTPFGRQQYAIRDASKKVENLTAVSKYIYGQW